eukprot:6188010-Pleurochrysis_carterae.AAC.5
MTGSWLQLAFDRFGTSLGRLQSVYQSYGYFQRKQLMLKQAELQANKGSTANKRQTSVKELNSMSTRVQTYLQLNAQVKRQNSLPIMQAPSSSRLPERKHQVQPLIATKQLCALDRCTLDRCYTP